LILSEGKLVYDGPTEAVFYDEVFLQSHSLETPLSFSRPYCQLCDVPQERVAITDNGRIGVV
jgi:cobalt/nickel transport system ATP-binding protein